MESDPTQAAKKLNNTHTYKIVHKHLQLVLYLYRYDFYYYSLIKATVFWFFSEPVYQYVRGFTPGGGVTPYNGLYGEAPPERGTFSRLQVYKRVGISRV